MAKKTTMSSELKNAFKAIEELNEYATTLSNESLSVIKSYVDTGSMALNAIISGSLYGGVPEGRIIGFSGPESSGKTLILSKLIANKQKMDPGAWGVIWDSEAAYDTKTISNVGGDPSRVKVCPVDTVEACKNQISNFLDRVVADKSLHGKFIIGIDSLGNLASDKAMQDAAKGSMATDMGTRAKAIKSMMQILTQKCNKSSTTLVFSNHIYDNPASLYPSIVKSQSGGKGPMYMSSVLVQLDKTNVKHEEKEEAGVLKPVGRMLGVNISAMCVKNRFVPPFAKTELELNYITGLYKYSGLLDLGVSVGAIIKQDRTYELPDGTKLGFEKKFKHDDEIWSKIIPVIEQKLQETLKYSDNALINEPDDETTTEDS